jgi:hypothetical protein
MTRETLEDLREQLLRRHNVQQMIQARAYEIYRMRGGQPGGEAQDWFHAESEVLAFLMARDSAGEDEPAAADAAPAASDLELPKEAARTKKPRTRAAAKPSNAKQPSAKKTSTKQAKPKKPTEPKSKSKRPLSQSKTEESGQ